MSPSDYYASEMPIPQSAVPETPGGIRRYISSVPSVSIPHAGAGLPPAQLRMAATHRTVTTTITTPQMRRSTTTRSSSPSSETTRFFSRSRSSSSSSYGEAMVPPIPSMPSARAGKGATSPREYSSGHNEKGRDNVAVERSPSVKTSRTSEETSSGIPSFEAYNPVNKFLPYGGRRPSVSLSPISHFPDHEPIAQRTEHAKRTHAPPIPRRNPHRPSHPSVSIPSLPLPVHQHSMPNVIPVQDASESEALDGDALDALRAERRRDTEQTPTIPKARPRSISDGAIIPEPERHAHSANSTSVTFREMTRTQRQLTEQEKTAKWEDLLQRSAKAGGTLHVGSPTTGGGLGLWSDRSSVALSENLDSTDQE
ncbi:hypothetical protein JB92DRAFT_907830 [Gautieria morchelliformis]|nr:hypothetical protein JB92DRAFT_907830 [Gautieria morchelliformis]